MIKWIRIGVLAIAIMFLQNHFSFCSNARRNTEFHQHKLRLELEKKTSDERADCIKKAHCRYGTSSAYLIYKFL